MQSLLSSDIWNRASDNVLMRVDIYKTQNGVLQQIFEDNSLIQEISSPRPYKLGQSCDGTIDDCVHALFILFCRDQNIDLQMLYNSAYPNSDNPYNLSCQNAMIESAMKQGIIIPKKWDHRAFELLCISLCEINHHSLMTRLEQEVSHLHKPLQPSYNHPLQISEHSDEFSQASAKL